MRVGSCWSCCWGWRRICERGCVSQDPIYKFIANSASQLPLVCDVIADTLDHLSWRKRSSKCVDCLFFPAGTRTYQEQIVKVECLVEVSFLNEAPAILENQHVELSRVRRPDDLADCLFSDQMIEHGSRGVLSFQIQSAIPQRLESSRDGLRCRRIESRRFRSKL